MNHINQLCVCCIGMVSSYQFTARNCNDFDNKWTLLVAASYYGQIFRADWVAKARKFSNNLKTMCRKSRKNPRQSQEICLEFQPRRGEAHPSKPTGTMRRWLHVSYILYRDAYQFIGQPKWSICPLPTVWPIRGVGSFVGCGIYMCK